MSARQSQSGQSMTEFLIIFPMLILLVFGIIQFALIYQARATLNNATLLAARAGAVNNGSNSSMRTALASGLAPLFATQPSMAGYGRALVEANLETTPNLTRIDVLNPNRAALNDFGRTRVDGQAGRELPNDTLSYRNSTPGSASKISVQDANILHVRVSYCLRLLVPVLDRVIHAGVNALSPMSQVLSANGMQDPFGTGGTTVSTGCISPLSRGPRIVIRSEAMVRMQSPFHESNL